MDDKELFSQYIEKMESFNDDRFSFMSKDMLHGHNSYLRLKFAGSSIFNPVWIKMIEDCLYELGQIINNPREVTTQEGAVMPIELAKKINYESVQHLASHTQYIKEIKDNGDIVPSKILGIYNKDEIHTYENRFIATFIRRLVLFVEKRYEFIKETVNLNEKEIMYVKNKSVIDGQEVEIETKITVTREKEDDLTIKAKDYIARIEELKRYVTYYYNSPFMKEFKTEKDVRKPILLTNIIRKNPLYHKCYETFLFIEKFDSLGVAFKVDRNWQEFNEKERKQLSYILLSNLLFLQHTEGKKPYKKFEKVYKPKLLSSIDDESFLYGDLVKGPVEFVRCDEHYLNYLKDLAPQDLPIHPNKVEKEYYKEEYNEKKNLHSKVKEIEALLARIRREIAKFEKKVAKLLDERNIEEAAEAQRHIDELRAQEQSILDKKREEIIKAAREEDNKPAKKEKKKKVEEVKEEPAPVVEESKDEEQVHEEPVSEPVAEETPTEEPVVVEAPQEEAPVEEAPAEEPVIVEQPEPEPEVVEEVNKEEPVEEPVQEEPQQEAEESPVLSEPVEEVKEETEPQQEETPNEEPVQEETPVEEQPVEETPAEEPVTEEPKHEEAPVEEKKKKAKKPANKRKKAAKAAPKEEKPVEQEPVKGEPQSEPEPVPVAEEHKEEKPKKKPAKKRAPRKPKPVPVKEEPVSEPEPAPQPEPEPEPVPVVVPAPEPKKKAKKPAAKKKAPKAKPAPAKKEPKPKKPAPKKEKEKPEVIPGKFIVKTAEGYYVNQKKTSIMKNDARIFNDFNEANKIKAKMGGKVVKL